MRKNIPYLHHITDTVISTDNGEIMTVFKVAGRTHECASDAELIGWHSDFNKLLMQIGSEHVKIWTHEHHHDVDEFQETVFDQYFPDYLDKYYRQNFADLKPMRTDLYLTIVYAQIGDVAQKFLSKFDKPSPQELIEMREEALHAMEEITGQVMSSLHSYGIEPLGIYYRDARGNEIVPPDEEELAADADIDVEDLLDDYIPPAVDENAAATANAHTFSKALEFLSFLLNGEWSLVPVARNPIQDYLAESRLVSSMFGDCLQIRTIDHDLYTTGIEIRDYDEQTEPGQLNLLKEADFEYVLTQCFCLMSHKAAQNFLSNQEKALLETNDRGRSQVNQMSDALDDVVSRRFNMGFHYAVMHVQGATAKEAQKIARRAKVMLNQCGVVAGGVSLASEAAWFFRLPANSKFIPRPCAINSRNFLHFSPFHNFMSGKPVNNPWGPAVALLRTVSGTPIYFNFHPTPLSQLSYGKRPLGHTLILGRAGAGKTTLLNFLLTQATKFNPQMFIYDKDRGMEALVRALGGHYRVLRDGEATGFAPLQQPSTLQNIAMVKRLLRHCCEIVFNADLPGAFVEELNQAIDTVMGPDSAFALQDRTLSMLLGNMEDPKTFGGEMTLSRCLEPWCVGGEFGWLFDNEKDVIDFSTHSIYGHDLSDFVVEDGEQPPKARTPLLMYLTYRTRQAINGKRRSMQVFDEFHMYLDDPMMRKEVKRGIKTDRKKDCIYVFATQEANDALASKIGKTVVSQTPTKIMLENREADLEDYGPAGLKLTTAEIDALMSIPEHSRQFLLKQGSESALAVLDLSPRVDTDRNRARFDNILSVLSGTGDNAERAEEVIRTLGTDEPAAWLPAYWKEVRRSTEATL